MYLAGMGWVVPWARLCALIEPYYPKSGATGGRPAKPLETILRIHFVQRCFSQPDPAMEDAADGMICAKTGLPVFIGDTRSPVGKIWNAMSGDH